MKKYIKISLLFSLCCLFFLSGTSVAKAEQYKYTELKPNILGEFTNSFLTPHWTDTPNNTNIITTTDLGIRKDSSDEFFTSHHYYKFTLDKPSMVRVFAWSNFTDNGVEISPTTIEQNNPQEWSEELWQHSLHCFDMLVSRQKDRFELSDVCGNPDEFFLDSGTYYIRLDFNMINIKDNTLIQSMIGKVMMEAVPVTDFKIIAGNNQTGAQKIIANKTYDGRFWYWGKRQYFCYEASCDASIKIKLNTEKFTTIDDFCVEVMDADSSLLCQKYIGTEGEVSAEVSCKVKKGINYIVIYQSAYRDDALYGGITYSLVVTTSEKHPVKDDQSEDNGSDEEHLLKTPKLIKYKRGTKLIKGKAVNDAKVSIDVNGKKYTANVKDGVFKIKLKKTLKKGMIIKISAVLGGKTSKTKIYTVK